VVRFSLLSSNKRLYAEAGCDEGGRDREQAIRDQQQEGDNEKSRQG
jgi:hypothetical protein